MTSTTSNSSYPTDVDEDSRTAIYISVPVSIITSILLALTIFLVIRNRRQKRQTIESDAIYNSGNDTPRRNRRSVPGIENQAYCTYTLENRNKPRGDKAIPRSDQYSTTTSSNIIPLSSNINNYKNTDLQTEDIPEDEYAYNHLVIPTIGLNTAPYSYVTNGPDGFTIDDDSAYSDLESQKKKSYNEAGGVDNGIDSKQVLNAKKYENASRHFEIQSSVYDHAVAGGPDPDVITADEYYHLNGTKEHEKRNNAQRHSYVNVTKENEHEFIPSKTNNTGHTYDHVKADGQYPMPIKTREYAHLNQEKGNENSAVSPGHRYVNVTKDQDPLARGTRADGYEEAVGRTPAYFVIEP